MVRTTITGWVRVNAELLIVGLFAYGFLVLAVMVVIADWLEADETVSCPECGVEVPKTETGHRDASSVENEIGFCSPECVAAD